MLTSEGYVVKNHANIDVRNKPYVKQCLLEFKSTRVLGIIRIGNSKHSENKQFKVTRMIQRLTRKQIEQHAMNCNFAKRDLIEKGVQRNRIN